MEIANWVPQNLVEFVLIVLFSLSIGLEQRKRFPNEKEKLTFGTDRTFTFIGVLGFMLLLVDTERLIPFLVGFVTVGSFLAIYYFQKIKNRTTLWVDHSSSGINYLFFSFDSA